MSTMFKFFIVLMSFLLLGCNSSEQAFKSETNLGEFGAYYTKLNSGEKFEAYSRTGPYADVIVDLGKNDAMFVFWRGTSFLPFLQSLATSATFKSDTCFSNDA